MLSLRQTFCSTDLLLAQYSRDAKSGGSKAQTRRLPGARMAKGSPVHKENPADNEPGAVEKTLGANAILCNAPWPAPFDATTHRLQSGDARRLDWISFGPVRVSRKYDQRFGT
jgi:hypothetical protein